MPQRPNRGGAFEKWTVRLLLPALVLALGAAIAGLFGFRAEEATALWDGPERGEWQAVQINGQDVRAHGYIVSFENGEIVGGKDGCNNWGFTDDVDPVTGERMVMSDLMYCPPGPADDAYWSLASGPTEFTLDDTGTLEIRNANDERYSPVGFFRRLEDLRGAVDPPVDESELPAQPPPPPAPPPPIPGVNAPPPPPTHPKPTPPPS